MALEVYFKNDIQQGIVAMALMALKAYRANGGHNVEHLRGILDLAEGLSALYNLSWPALLGEILEALNGNLRTLLDRAMLGERLLADDLDDHPGRLPA